MRFDEVYDTLDTEDMSSRSSRTSFCPRSSGGYLSRISALSGCLFSSSVIDIVEFIEPDDDGVRDGERALRGFWFCTLGEEDVSFLDLDFWTGGAVRFDFGVGLSGTGCT